MNANPKFLSASATVDAAAVEPLPNSRKVYVAGSRPDIRVPMREISQSDTPASFGGETNPPVYVYDTSGPYTDPEARIDIRSRPAGAARAPGSKSAATPRTGRAELRDYGRERLHDPKLGRAALPTCTRSRAARGSGANVTQMHYARQGIVTPEMEYVAIRENLRRQEYLQGLEAAGPMARAWRSCWAASTRASRSAPRFRARSRPSSCATKWRAAARSSRPTSTTRKSSR